MAQFQADGAWIYHCDDLLVEPRSHRLERAGTPLSVEPKAYTVLMVLLQQAGEVVSKDELLDAAWGHRHVTPGVLTRAVSQLRHSLGDCATSPRYIATVHSLGYRFIGEVHRIPVMPLALTDEAPTATTSLTDTQTPRGHLPPPPPMRPAPPLQWLAALLTVAVIVAMLAAVSLWHAPSDRLSSPHVLPRPALVLIPMAHTLSQHARRWPRAHRMASDYPGDGLSAHAAGFLRLRPEQAPAARD
ncbi:winged helix-turn-helix domain-containing protein [Dyella sp. ASV21]|uniref:winged helix-turn-helix domain-containing protein n=1 Tax=Dyella sp. ASV21 TaxID=2795114 RepID=UPI0018EA85F7|nr:winged helix-turn-helix domain-containing protein [Dyella sp. ASV21]